MGDYASTIVLAWPYPGENALPDTLRDLLAADGWLPDLDTPCDTPGDDDAVVLEGDSDSGAILAITDTQANDGTAAFSEIITALNDAGMSVYAANHPGDNYAAWSVYHLLGDEGRVTEHQRRFVDGEIVLGAGDLTGRDEYVAQLSDSELAARTRRLLDHPPELPAAVRALAWASGPRTPGGSAVADGIAA